MYTTETSITLLEGLRHRDDNAAWSRFDNRYRSMLVAVARRFGLDLHDAEDAAQRTLLAFVETYRAGKYDRDRGRLKNWLIGIARHKIEDVHKERARRPVAAGWKSASVDCVALLRDPASVTAIWDKEWRAGILRACFERAQTQFSARDVEIFRRLTVREQGIPDVADAMNMEPNAVYVVKHRILKFMREIQAEVTESW